MITEEQYREAKGIVKIYEEELAHKEKIRMMTQLLEDGESLEYRDLSGAWYPYDEGLLGNRFFNPENVRVKRKDD